MGAVSMWGLTHPACNPGGNPSDFNPNYIDITFTTPKGLKQQGYFIPGTNGATIIIAPAFNSGRGAELHYARIFNEAGFNVVTIDSRACSPQGWISLGYQEVEDVQAAYDYLKTRGDIDLTRVDLHGFSSAGATVIMAGEQMPEIRGISAEGGYHDFPDVMGIGQSDLFLVQIYRLGAYTTYGWVTGTDIQNLSPISGIDQLAGRHLLLVYGSLENSLPGARKTLEAALADGVDADLWVVEGADHGGYLSVAPDETVRRLVDFHSAVLLNKPA